MHQTVEAFNHYSVHLKYIFEKIGFLTRASPLWLGCLAFFVLLMIFLNRNRNQKTEKHFYLSDTFFILAIICSILILRTPYLLYTQLNPDETQWIIGAATFAKYPHFWLSVDATTSGPLVVIPLSIVVWIGGILNYATARLFATCFFLIPSVLFVYYSTKKMFTKEIADFITIVVAFLVSTQTVLLNYNGEFSIILFTSASLYFYSKIDVAKAPLYLYGITGFIVSCLPFTKPQAIPIGFMLFLIISYKIYLNHRITNRLLIFIMGCSIPFVFLIIYLQINDLFKDFYYSYILNSIYYGSASGTVKRDIPFFEVLWKTIQYLFYEVDVPLYFIFSIAVGTWGIIHLIRKDGFISKIKSSQHFNFHFAISLFLCALFCVVKPKTFFVAYQNTLLIPTSFLLANGLFVIRNRLNKQQFFTMFVVIMLSFSSLFIVKLHWDEAKWFVYNEHLRNIKLIETVQKNSTVDERMAIWGYKPDLFLECGRLQGTRDGHSLCSMRENVIKDYYLNRYLHDLQTIRPKIILENFEGIYNIFNFGPQPRRDFGIDKFPTVYKYVKENYILIADFDNNTRIFLRKASI